LALKILVLPVLTHSKPLWVLGSYLIRIVAIDYDASGFLSNTGNYNKVVSNEPVEVKKLFRDTYTTRLGVVVIRAYNAFIGVPDGSEGLDRRLTIIPFRQHPKTIDTGLSQKLEAELPGIFAWCYSMSASEMKQRLLMAGTIQAVAAMNIERFEANNPEFRFLCTVFPEGKARIKAGDVYSSYTHWCRENQHQPKSSVKFAPAIQALGCTRSKGKRHGNYYYTIPAMAAFDVEAHLGIVQRRLGDSCRDSSNPCTEVVGDSGGQFKPQSLQNLGEAKLKANGNEYEQKARIPPFQVSPTIPQPCSEGISTVSQLSKTVSQLSQTVSTTPQLLTTKAIEETTTDEPVNCSRPIAVGDQVRKRHRYGWVGTVQAIHTYDAAAEVLWVNDSQPTLVELSELEVTR
jgi:hypothetical protein